MKNTTISKVSLVILLVVLILPPALCQESVGINSAKHVKTPQEKVKEQKALSQSIGKEVISHKSRWAVADELIVVFRDGVQPSGVRTSLHTAMNTTVTRRLDIINADVVRLQPGMSLDDAIARYQGSSDVVLVEPNYIIQLPESEMTFLPVNPAEEQTPEPSKVANDPYYKKQWALKGNNKGGLDMTAAWKQTKGSPDVIVGVIDSGIDYTHEDLKNQMWVNTAEKNGKAGVDDDNNGYVDDIYGYDFCNYDGDPYDDGMHGTHVSGTIAAEMNNKKGIVGVAPGVRLMALKFLSSEGSGETVDAIACFEYARKMGASLTNNSWGGGGSSAALKKAIESYGKLCICASGNYGVDGDEMVFLPCGYPLNNIVSVMAVDVKGRVAIFSNYGKESVDIGAPGVDILSSLPEDKYAYASGTSMACPHVTGLTALILSKYPKLSQSEVLARLLLTGTENRKYTDKCVSGSTASAKKLYDPLNYPPSVDDLDIAGETWVGKKLQAEYEYYDAEGDPEGKSIINWYALDRRTGTEEIVARKTSSFTPGPEHGDMEICYRIMPVAKTGKTKGYISYSSGYTDPLSTDYPITRIDGLFAKSHHYLSVAGEVFLSGGSAVTEFGLVYSTDPDPTLDDTVVKLGHGTGAFAGTVKGLKTDTSYYVRAYAVNQKGIGYSRVLSVRTLKNVYDVHKLLPAFANKMLDYDFGAVAGLSGNACVVGAFGTNDYFVYRYNRARDTWEYVQEFRTEQFAKPPRRIYTASVKGDFLFLWTIEEKFSEYQKFLEVYKLDKKTNSYQLVKRFKHDAPLIWYLRNPLDSEVICPIMDYLWGKGTPARQINCVVFRYDKAKDKWQQDYEFQPFDPEDSTYYANIRVSENNMIIKRNIHNNDGDTGEFLFYRRNADTGRWEFNTRIDMGEEYAVDGNYSFDISENYAAICDFGVDLGTDYPCQQVDIFTYDKSANTWKHHQTEVLHGPHQRSWSGDAMVIYNDSIWLSHYVLMEEQMLGLTVLNLNAETQQFERLEGFEDLFMELEADDKGKHPYPSIPAFNLEIDREGGRLILGDYNNKELGERVGAVYIFDIEKLMEALLKQNNIPR